jgi:trehalose 6-phosphate phosphatase
MIRDLDRIFSPLLFVAAGLHGADIRLADGTRIGTSAKALDRLRPQIGFFIAERPDLLLEDKGATLAIHFRQRPDMAAEVREFLAHLAAESDFEVQEGKMVVELKPRGIDKGSALASLSERPPFRGRMPVFIGDDLTDEFGFRFVNRMGGISVRVGVADGPTQASHGLKNPAFLRDELYALTGCMRYEYFDGASGGLPEQRAIPKH